MVKKSLCVLLFSIAALVLATSNYVYAQNKGVTLNFDKSPLRGVLNQITSITGYRFVYTNEIDPDKIIISIKSNNEPIEKLFDRLFSLCNIEYKIKKQQVLLQPISKPLGRSKEAKDKNGGIITGRVTDELGESLPGCVIRQINGTTNTTSDSDGRYSIEVFGVQPTLEFTFIGMKTQNLTPNQEVCNVVMTSDYLQIEQVVVTGYQTLKKFNTTGSVNTLDNKKIELRSTQSLARVLEGSVPGLSIYNGRYTIRGGGSLKESSPLFIVDDFEVETLPQNMDNIESITVLKDAAAAAIWGSRAANGVIVITTKQGKLNDFKISYSSNLKITSKPNYNKLYRADSPALADYQKEAYLKEYIAPYIYEGSKSGYPDTYQVFFDHYNKLIDDSEMDKRLASISSYSNRAELEKLFLRRSISQNHMISVSGGTNKMSYYLSGIFTGSNSNYIGDSDRATGINIRSSYKAYSFLKIRSDISATFSETNNGYSSLSSEIYSMYPFQKVIDSEGAYVYDYTDFNKVENERLKGLGYLESGKNILEESHLSNDKAERTSYRVRIGADLKIIEGVQANIDYQFEKQNSERKNINSAKSWYSRTLINQYTQSVDNKLKLHIPYGDVMDYNSGSFFAWIAKCGLNLNRSFGRDNRHYVNAVAGFEVRKRVSQNTRFRKLGYDDQLLTWQPIDQLSLAQTGITWWDGRNYRYYSDSYDGFSYNDNREVSTFGSAVYTYDNRYTISGSLRFDESNLFGADKKFRRNPIWSVGVNWNVKSEKFFKSKIITDLILRATYGLTGNFDRSGSTTPIMVAKRQYLSSVGGYITRITSPPNPKLRWEKNRTVNISATVGIMDRFSAIVEYYNNYCYDLLGETILDPTVGYTRARINAADMYNRGVEITLNGDIIRKRGFVWNAGLIFTYNKNKILNNKISDSNPELNRPSGTTQFVEGYPKESLWSYRWGGLDSKGNPQTYDKDGNKTTSISPESVEFSGTYQPKYFGSFTNSFTYKNLTLNLLFVYNFGHVFRSEYPSMNPWESSPSTSRLIDNRWRKEGDENHTDIPAIWTQDWSNYIQYRDQIAMRSSNSVRDAGFIRLREILLQYQLPSNIVKRTPFRSVSLTAQANTLFLWTKNREGYDPEAVDPIRGTFSLPEPSSFTFGIKLEF